jgi:hypothetical protein
MIGIDFLHSIRLRWGILEIGSLRSLFNYSNT